MDGVGDFWHTLCLMGVDQHTLCEPYPITGERSERRFSKLAKKKVDKNKTI